MIAKSVQCGTLRTDRNLAFDVSRPYVYERPIQRLGHSDVQTPRTAVVHGLRL